jgi:hypothetical protein
VAGFGGSQPGELFGQDTDSVLAGIQAALRGILTTMPGIVQTDSDGHNVTVQPSINSIIRKDDGTMMQQPWPKLQTMVVHFAGGGLVTSTHPIKTNDEVIVQFAARALDSWRQSGGIQNPIDARQHHASDGFVLAGVKSDPNKIQNYATDSIQHRSLDAKITHDVHPTNGITQKVVDPTDTTPNPFQAAIKFIQTLHVPGSGYFHTTTNGTNTHTFNIQPLIGMIHQVMGSGGVVNTISNLLSGGIIHSATAGGVTNTHTNNPLTGIIASVANGAHMISALVASGISLTSSKNINLSSATGISLSAPSLGLPAGGVSSGALAPGAAASNVGPVGGGLSGTLPNPHLVIENPFVLCSLPAFANNAAAIAGGVVANQMYLNTSIASGEFVLCQAH